MSQYTNCTDLNEEFDGNLFKEYHDQLFQRIPLPLEVDPPKKDKTTDEDIVFMKCKWLIEYLTESLSFKAQVKGMVGKLLDLS